MHSGWLALEHYRLHVMEQWPDGPAKAAGIAAVRSALKRLAASGAASEPAFECHECLTNRNGLRLVPFRSRTASGLAA